MPDHRPALVVQRTDSRAIHAVQATRAGRRTLCGQWYASPTRARHRPQFAERAGDPHAEVTCDGYRRALLAGQPAGRPPG